MNDQRELPEVGEVWDHGPGTYPFVVTAVSPNELSGTWSNREEFCEWSPTFTNLRRLSLRPQPDRGRVGQIWVFDGSHRMAVVNVKHGLIHLREEGIGERISDVCDIAHLRENYTCIHDVVTCHDVVTGVDHGVGESSTVVAHSHVEDGKTVIDSIEPVHPKRRGSRIVPEGEYDAPKPAAGGMKTMQQAIAEDIDAEIVTSLERAVRILE